LTPVDRSHPTATIGRSGENFSPRGSRIERPARLPSSLRPRFPASRRRVSSERDAQALGLSDHIAVHGHQPDEVLLTGKQLRYRSQIGNPGSRTSGTVNCAQWLLRPVNDRAGTSPVIAALAESTNIAVCRRTTERRVPHGPKPPPKSLSPRPRPSRRRPSDPRRPRPSSPGRRPPLAASSPARGCRARSVAARPRPAFA
jgi:hypothetical protein